MSAGHEVRLPMIQPRCCRTKYCGEEKSLLATGPVRKTNVCGTVKVSDPAIRAAARRRVRKSRGEHAAQRHRVASMKESRRIIRD